MDSVAHKRPGVSALDSVALSMLLVGLAVSIMLVVFEAPVVDARWVPAMVVVTLGAVGWRVHLLLHSSETQLRRAGFWPALLAGCLLVFLSPVYGLYVFLGYLEAPILTRGPWRSTAMVVTAAACAYAQIGGWRSPVWSWPVYGLFLTVNIGIALLIMLIERQRERMMQDLERTVAELRASEQRNARLQDQLLVQARDAGVQDERSRLSREIHDTVAQSLVGIITQLEAASDVTAPDRALRVERAGSTAREALGEARRAVRALASPRLDENELPAALAQLLRQTTDASGMETRFNLDGEPTPTSSDGTLLRVCQEALSNVAKHAQASKVVVTLGYADHEVRLDIVDDGCGFDPTRVRSGFGIPGLRRRLNDVGGTLELVTSEGGGCTLSAAVPHG